MKHIYILAYSLLLVFPALLSAQDLIVTSEGDSLNCKITKMKNEKIHFIYKYNNEIRTTVLFRDKIKHFQFDFYEIAELPLGKIKINTAYPRFRVAVNGSWGYRTSELTFDNFPDLEGYMKKLRSGFGYDLDFSYYFSKYCGIGIGYSGFFSKNEIENWNVFVPDIHYGGYYLNWGELRDEIRIDFIGAFLNSRILLNPDKTNGILFGLGIGYIGYNNKKTFYFQNLRIKGGTIGFCCNIGYDQTIYKNLSIGFQASYIFGILTHVRVNNGNYTQPEILGNYENLSRINLSVGLRFIK